MTPKRVVLTELGPFPCHLLDQTWESLSQHPHSALAELNLTLNRGANF